jgi:hypothetical protein
LNLRAARGFFMGVLGWTPATVMQGATLEDLADAHAGYLRAHGIAAPEAPPVGAGFLAEMMRKFPDTDRRHEP